MEGNAIEPALLGQENEAVYGQRRLFGQQVDHNLTLFRHDRGRVFLLRVDNHRRAFCELPVFQQEGIHCRSHRIEVHPYLQRQVIEQQERRPGQSNLPVVIVVLLNLFNVGRVVQVGLEFIVI